jgi:thiamine-monophosphate kinase
VANVDALIDGMIALARRARISIVGGNIARSPGPLIVDVTVIGSVHRRRILTRSTARAGDELYVTGSLGGSAAGLRMLRQNTATTDIVVERYRRPEPRSRFGLMLGRNQAARACIDLSDGLADGVRQIGNASGLGAVVDVEALPLENGATLRDALGGGEDYELLFAVSPRQRSRLASVRRLVKDLSVTRIGHLTSDRAMLLSRDGSTEALPAGFSHF